jgi:hypothetical protein
MVNVQKHNNCINVPLLQTRSYIRLCILKHFCDRDYLCKGEVPFPEEYVCGTGMQISGV